ncbi:hypothetical protein ACJBLD_19590 [Acinetobacter nosocomialis]|uniref:hypothetical protein n=1 Tax=Acinetobacter TaxID=469 RepID=UPI0002E6E687|nr:MULTISPECIES: hypothetical protein [Acinetobacter]EXE97470.1 hypothetical protein J594_3388 [Acinetobacter sp. 259052]EYT19604.1 hypothetical protein J595_01125 [Acinetobacter sp. 1592897]MBD8351730.1 hypothetical protein [Acinetobacter nosocomialis]MBJ9961447.1 hypothetical protein [Acinetobacter nosocomialis]MBR7749923.1 hypothetical protein [Acinetobacter nosocomialis]
MDLEWIEKQRRELEKRFNPELYRLNELKRQKELDELYGQLLTPRFNTVDINAIRKRAIPQELWKDQKIKELEDKNKELKRQLALKTLTYK